MASFNTFAIIQCILLTTATSLHDNIYKKDPTMQNFFCEEEATIVLGAARSVQRCATLCHKNSLNCRSFFYMKNRERCKGVPAVLYSNTPCPLKTGYSYYREKVFRSRFGDVCSYDGQCVMTAGKCINGACSCVAGYSHDPSIGSCVQACNRYGSTFIEYENLYLAGTLAESISDVSFDYCKELCSNSTVCRGFNYRTDHRRCRASEITPLTDPDAYENHSIIKYYHRNCA